MKSLVTISVLVLIVRKCCGISLDYFQESELKISEDESSVTSESDTTTTVSQTPYRRVDGDNICTLEDGKTTSTNVSQNREDSTPINEETTVTTTLLNFLKFYHYDEDGDSVLRSYPVDKEDLFIEKEKDKIITSKKEYSTHSTKLYSLEPAIESFNFTDLYTPADNTWYVLDRAPCWNLPLIYGQSVETNRNVFSVYRALLKEVIFDEEKIVTSNNGLMSLLADTMHKSRWCEMAPCYGDHILCKKRSTGDSKICGIGFVARTPKVSQQKAIANTVNKFRNHVARGNIDEYPYLQPAANMKQMVYDKDLERMALAWVRQCLPGPAPCASLDEHLVTQLECTKYHNTCCQHLDKHQAVTNCTPEPDCIVEPLLGCLHTWFWSAGRNIDDTDIKCGHIEESTFQLAQLIWAETDKIGCAYGTKPSGDIRVICSFAPGARYLIKTDYYCGLIQLPIFNAPEPRAPDVTDLKYLKKYKDIIMRAIQPESRFKLMERNITSKYTNHDRDHVDISMRNQWGVAALTKIYNERWARHHANVFSNGTLGMLARLVTRYSFEEETRARCDDNYPIYVIGEPASLCSETGTRFKALCYDYTDPTPEFRLAAILASISLFILILFDLFRSSVRQGTY